MNSLPNEMLCRQSDTAGIRIWGPSDHESNAIPTRPLRLALPSHTHPSSSSIVFIHPPLASPPLHFPSQHSILKGAILNSAKQSHTNLSEIRSVHGPIALDAKMQQLLIACGNWLPSNTTRLGGAVVAYLLLKLQMGLRIC